MRPCLEESWEYQNWDSDSTKSAWTTENSVNDPRFSFWFLLSLFAFSFFPLLPNTVLDCFSLTQVYSDYMCF